MLERTNLTGAVVAVAFYVSSILVFIFRLLGMPWFGHWIGYVEFLLAIPMAYLIVKAPQLSRDGDFLLDEVKRKGAMYPA